MLTAEIVAVGREILYGRTLDTNSNWICNELVRLGVTVKRIYVVDDVYEEIAEIISLILKRHPNICITTGGLGPTFDDITVESVARTLKLDLEENQVAINYILDYLKKRNLELTKERRKMALMPRNAIPLKNEVGTAPGIFFNYEGINFFMLPGVPAEMKNLFTNHVKQIIERMPGRDYFGEVNIEIRGIPESDLSKIINQLRTKYPNFYFKSNPKGFDEGRSVIVLNITIFTSDKDKLNLLEEIKKEVFDRLKGLATSLKILEQ
ncbi:MAG: molybdopterin-binding protein [Thermoproteota archaeon]|jgi:Predicted nucleotide-utilizing enzyme related to molybdopterin-biosynthesis enzyme MoeA